MANDTKFMDPSSIWYMVPCLGKRRKVITHSSPPSQEHNHSTIDMLPDQLLMEILCRLPNCKSAVQCKSVCKRWDALVSQPYFITHFVTHKISCGFIHIDTVSSSSSNINHHMIPTQNGDGCSSERNGNQYEEQQLLGVVMQHHKYHPQGGLLMHLMRPLSHLKGVSFGSLPCFEGGHTMPVNVVGAFNDLLLCHKENSDGQKHELFLCNVQTRQWHVLPSPSLVSEFNHFGFLCEPYYYFEKRNNDTHIVRNALYRYSVVILPHKYKWKTSFTEFNVLIYSSVTNQWRESLISLPRPSMLESPNTCGFGFNGIIHFRSLYYIVGFDPYSNSDTNGDGNAGVIQCHLIKWPSNHAITDATFAVFQGHLQASRIDDDGRLDIWLLKDYEMGVWSLQYSLLMKDFFPHPPSLAKHLERQIRAWVLGFHPSCPHLLYLFCGGHIVLCDVHNRLLEVASRIPLDFRKLFFCWDTLFWVTLLLWPTPLCTCLE